MARIVSVLSARPPGSRADAVGRRAGHRLVAAGHNVVEVHLRELPAESLLWRDVDHPSLVAVVEAVTRADGLIVTSPVHQASIAAPVKAFLDLFPMSGLRGTTVLPFMVGGSAGHVLALDYGLRPVLQGLAPAHLA
ncbi:MAG: NAD(P)H-dependent oxidoreductase, partial [Propioniciclava sp.]